MTTSLCLNVIALIRLKHPTDEGVIPETSRTDKTEHFFYEHFSRLRFALIHCSLKVIKSNSAIIRSHLSCCYHVQRLIDNNHFSTFRRQTLRVVMSTNFEISPTDILSIYTVINELCSLYHSCHLKFSPVLLSSAIIHCAKALGQYPNECNVIVCHMDNHTTKLPVIFYHTLM